MFEWVLQVQSCPPYLSGAPGTAKTSTALMRDAESGFVFEACSEHDYTRQRFKRFKA